MDGAVDLLTSTQWHYMFEGIEIEFTTEALEWFAIRREAALHIDPDTAEVDWHYGAECDPYGFYPTVQSNRGEKHDFARSPGSDVWVRGMV